MPVFAQNLPFHEDPSARERSTDQANVASLRFLTTNNFPPFNYKANDGQLIGFHIDLARAICAAIEAVCTIQAWPWDQVSDALADNQGDAFIGGMALNDENARQFDFSTVYLSFPARFATQLGKVTPFDPQKPGLKVAVRAGSAHADFVRKYLPNAVPVESETEITALQSMADGKADVFFGDALRTSFWLNEQGDCCAFVGDAYFRPDLFGAGLAIAVPSGQDNIRTALNVALAQLQRDGTFDELYLKWFPVSFY